MPESFDYKEFYRFRVLDAINLGHHGNPFSRMQTICVPTPPEADYEKLIKNPTSFRAFLDPIIEKHPELFPEGISNGYWLHSTVHSKKLNLTTRRIQLVSNKAVYQIRPDTILPYMVGLTDEIEKALYLRRFGVPIDAIVYVFGRDPSYWYRLYLAMGRYSMLAPPSKLPRSFHFTWSPMKSIVGGLVSESSSQQPLAVTAF